MLIFFIAVSFISCAFERVDNSGAYSISSETGLLIPSVYINNDSRHFGKTAIPSVSGRRPGMIANWCFQGWTGGWR